MHLPKSLRALVGQWHVTPLYATRLCAFAQKGGGRWLGMLFPTTRHSRYSKSYVCKNLPPALPCFGWGSSLVCTGTAQGSAQELFSWGKKSSWVKWKNHSGWILLPGNMLVQSGLSEQNTAGGKGSLEQWSDLLQRLKFSSYLDVDLFFLSWR